MKFPKRLMAYPTRERLHELLRLENGILYWREHKQGRKPTLEAGCMNKGTPRIRFDGVLYREDDLVRIYLEEPKNDSSPCSVGF